MLRRVSLFARVDDSTVFNHVGVVNLPLTVEPITEANRRPTDAPEATERLSGFDLDEALITLRGLEDYEITGPGGLDPLQLTHTPCGEVLCDVETDDTIGVLLRMAVGHGKVC